MLEHPLILQSCALDFIPAELQVLLPDLVDQFRGLTRVQTVLEHETVR